MLSNAMVNASLDVRSMLDISAAFLLGPSAHNISHVIVHLLRFLEQLIVLQYSHVNSFLLVGF